MQVDNEDDDDSDDDDDIPLSNDTFGLHPQYDEDDEFAELYAYNLDEKKEVDDSLDVTDDKKDVDDSLDEFGGLYESNLEQIDATQSHFQSRHYKATKSVKFYILKRNHEKIHVFLAKLQHVAYIYIY